LETLAPEGQTTGRSLSITIVNHSNSPSTPRHAYLHVNVSRLSRG
jgi:hypothetical protein